MNAVSLLRGGMTVFFGVLAVVIAYEDATTHKIRNVRVAGGLAACAAGYAALFAAGLWSGAPQPAGYFASAALNAALSLAIAVAFWQADIWPAGDAKLFIMTAVALPLLHSAPPRFPHAFFLVLLINIYLPCLAVMLVSIGIQFAGKWTRGSASPRWLVEKARDFALEKARSLSSRDLKAALGVFALFIAGTGLRLVLVKASGYWLTAHALFYLLLYLYWNQLWSLMADKMGSALIYLSGAYLALGAAAFPGTLAVHLRHAAAMYAGFGGAFMLLRLALERGSRALEGRVIDAMAVQAGNVPLELKLDARFNWDDFGPLSRDGLSAAQAAQLKAWALPLAPERRLITISSDSRAFAGWIVGGAALTLLIRADVLHYCAGWARARF